MIQKNLFTDIVVANSQEEQQLQAQPTDNRKTKERTTTHCLTASQQNAQIVMSSCRPNLDGKHLKLLTK